MGLLNEWFVYISVDVTLKYQPQTLIQQTIKELANLLGYSVEFWTEDYNFDNIV